MKKIKSLLLVLLCSLFVFTGCEDDYDKETESQKLQTYDKTGIITFEYEKKSSNNIKTSYNVMTIKDNKDNSEIKITALHDLSGSPSIKKKENDFGKEYHNYREVKVGKNSGWEVYKDENEYKTVLTLTSKDRNDKVYAVEIEVNKENVSEFINGEDFQHLLKTIKFKDNR